jgi:hypothetical protein
MNSARRVHGQAFSEFGAFFIGDSPENYCEVKIGRRDSDSLLSLEQRYCVDQLMQRYAVANMESILQNFSMSMIDPHYRTHTRS